MRTELSIPKKAHLDLCSMFLCRTWCPSQQRTNGGQSIWGNHIQITSPSLHLQNQHRRKADCTGHMPSMAKKNGVNCRTPGKRIRIEVLEYKSTQPKSNASWEQADVKNLMALSCLIFTTASEVSTVPFPIYQAVGDTSQTGLGSPCSTEGETYC